MNVLVTGGAGFIGSHLCARLLNEGHSVVCVDNFLTGRKENVDALMKHEQFTFIEHDINKPLLYGGEIDQIYNLASPASPKDFEELQLEIIHVNSYGLENMLDLARDHKARIVNASTSEVYGDPEIHPQKEGYFGNVNTYGPRSCYDESKRFGEALIYAYKKKYDVNTGIVRIFNTYGPHMRADDGRVVSNFITQALNNESVTVYGDGMQTRSFCYVDDMVDGFIRMMDSDVEGPLNLGNDEEYTVIDLARKIIELSGSSSEIIFKELPQDDPVKRKPSLEKAQAEIGFSPGVSVDDGLAKTIEYFKKELTSQS